MLGCVTSNNWLLVLTLVHIPSLSLGTAPARGSGIWSNPGRCCRRCCQVSHLHTKVPQKHPERSSKGVNTGGQSRPRRRQIDVRPPCTHTHTARPCKRKTVKKFNDLLLSDKTLRFASHRRPPLDVGEPQRRHFDGLKPLDRGWRGCSPATLQWPPFA